MHTRQNGNGGSTYHSDREHFKRLSWSTTVKNNRLTKSNEVLNSVLTQPMSSADLGNDEIISTKEFELLRFKTHMKILLA